MSSPTATAITKVDACVHPFVRRSADLRAYLAQPWRSHGFPGPEEYDHLGIGPVYCEPETGEGIPGSDPDQVIRRIFAEDGMDRAVLVPRTRGLVPDLDLSAALCGGTNAWLAAEWLDPHRDRFVGTIRVDPRDPGPAVAEIRRWAGHPGMVQVGVPSQAQAPYGHRQYYPVWAELAELGLPLVLCADGGNGIHFPLTVAGHPTFRIEREVLQPANFAFHLASMLAEGVFERFPGLRVVFADGGHDMLTPIMWRFHKDWRGNRPDIPWLKRSPFEYLAAHVRFVTDALAGAPDEAAWQFWTDLGDASTLLLYGSRYPRWSRITPDAAVAGLRAETSAAVLGGNASVLYGLDSSGGDRAEIV